MISFAVVLLYIALTSTGNAILERVDPLPQPIYLPDDVRTTGEKE